MSISCENCGQAVLPTDLLCWHCGAKQPRRKNALAAKSELIAADSTPVSLRYTAVLSMFLLVLLAAIFFFTARLAAHPLVRTLPHKPLDPQWQSVTNEQLHFTFNVPPRWEQMPTALPRDPGFKVVAAELAQLSPDATPVFWGTVTETVNEAEVTAFLMIAESERLAMLTTTDLGQLVAQQFSDALLREQIAGDFDNQRVNVVWVPALAPQPLRCQLHLLNPGGTAVLFTICAPATYFAPMAKDYQQILDSYQSLSR